MQNVAEQEIGVGIFGFDLGSASAMHCGRVACAASQKNVAQQQMGARVELIQPEGMPTVDLCFVHLREIV